MKLAENESSFFNSTLSHKPVSKASELVNDAFESDKLKMQSEEHRDVKGRKDLDDDMQYATKEEIFMNPLKEDFSCLHRVDDDRVKVFNIESPEKDSEVNVKQNVPEYDLPEIIVCYKENSSNIVKDISIDEGTMPSPLPVRVVFEKDEHENDQNDELMKALQIADIALDNEFKNSEQSLSEKDLGDQIDANELVPSVGVDRDSEYLNTKQTVELEPCDDANELVPSVGVDRDLEYLNTKQTVELERCNGNFSGDNGSICLERDLEYLNTKQTVELEPCDENFNGDDGPEEDTVQVSSEIENSANSSSVYACENMETEAEKLEPTDLYPVSILEEPRDNSIPNDLSYNSKVENESITFNFSSSESGSKENTEVLENGANLEERSKSEFGKLSKVEDRTSNQIQLGTGESSSSLVNFSGPVAYSGSLSIRSDSSTTSTRSFAFPMLQADWHHNSPVRMAKADRRFFRKDRGWRQGLFCCRF